MSVILAVEYMSTLYTGRKYVCRKKYVRWRNVRRKDVPVPVGDAKETSASSIEVSGRVHVHFNHLRPFSEAFHLKENTFYGSSNSLAHFILNLN